uniref:Uncharacterized protein n=1 Tax=Anopheles atroparvus TaxID=41427 RepID=A0A182IZF6_ANOAO
MPREAVEEMECASIALRAEDEADPEDIVLGDVYAIDDDDEPETDSNDFVMQDNTLEDCLRYVALRGNVPHSTLNLFLQIIREKTNMWVPKDARTLLRTSREKKS